MLVTILTALQVVLCFALVGLVLLQHGKGADAGAGFGAGASGSVFGAGGSATFLSRTTAILATLFFLNCVGLSYLVEKQIHRAPAALLQSRPAVIHKAQTPPAPRSVGAPARVPAPPAVSTAAAPGAAGGASPKG
jgi:preprotein translocase subunit SecG